MSLTLSHAGSSFLWLLVVNAPEAKAPSAGPPMILAMRTGDTRLEHPPLSLGRVDRYFELDRASVSGRFRSVERSGGEVALTELQYQGALTGRFKLDSRGKLAVRAGAFTGNGFTGGWNGAFHLKQLFLETRAVPRLSVQIGGIDIAHGEATEVTSYDFDGYLGPLSSGKRVYGTALLPIGGELALSVFFSQALGEAEPSSLRRRLDLALSYNVLESFSFRRGDLSGS